MRLFIITFQIEYYNGKDPSILSRADHYILIQKLEKRFLSDAIKSLIFGSGEMNFA